MFETIYQGSRQAAAYSSLDSMGVVGRLAEGQSIVLAPSGESTIKPPPAFGASSYVKTLAKLRYLSRYVAGWDGPGTRAALGVSFRLAQDFLGLLPQFGILFRVDAMIYAPGTAALSVCSDQVDARLEFLTDGTIAANVDTAGAQIDADVFGFDGKVIPEELVSLLTPRQRQKRQAA
jgi:hypothetical protein